MTQILLVTGLFEVRGSNMSASQAALDILKSRGYDGITVPSNQELSWLLDLDGASQVWPYLWLTDIVYPPWGSPGLIDLTNQHGSLTNMLTEIAEILAVCNQTGSPGILFDFEFYDGGANKYVDGGASLLGISTDLFEALCYQFGADLADCVNDVKPDAIIWTTLSPLRPIDQNYTYYWIALGLLQRARDAAYTFTFVSGNEIEIGYMQSISQFTTKSAAVKLATPTFPNLKLSAPLVLWTDSALVTGWVKQYQPASGYSVSRDFYPLLNLAFHAFDYAWVYNEEPSGYTPCSGAAAATMGSIINHAKYRRKIEISRGYDVLSAVAQHDTNFAAGRYIQNEELSA